MKLPLIDMLLALPVFALAMCRVGGLMMTAPMLSSQAIPMRIRATLAMFLAVLAVPVVAASAPEDVTLGRAIAGAVPEMAIGAAMGLTLTICLMGAETAGNLIGQQAGLSLGQIIDPMQNANASIIGQVYVIVMTIVLVTLGAHRDVIRALFDTYEVIPALSFSPGDSLLMLLVETTGAAFAMGIRIAAPVLLALFIAATVMGVMARTIPQVNVITVGFTAKVLLALGAASIALAASEQVMVRAIMDAVEAIRATFGLERIAAGGGS